MISKPALEVLSNYRENYNDHCLVLLLDGNFLLKLFLSPITLYNNYQWMNYMKSNRERGENLPPGDCAYPKTVGNTNGPEIAIDHAKQNYDQKDGRITITGSIEMDNNKTLETLGCESVDLPIVITPEVIEGAVIKGKRELTIGDVKNIWLYGIDFEDDPSGEAKDTIGTFEKAKRSGIARCDFTLLGGG
jgi:hypothetical protein